MKSTDFNIKRPKKVAEAKVEAPVKQPTVEELVYPEFTFESAEKQYKKVVNENRVDSPVSSAITRRILNSRPDLLKFGPEKVMAAIDEVAEWVGDVDEIGTSDVSAWVDQVARYLRTANGEGLKEDASAGASGSSSVAVSMQTLGEKGSFSKKDVNKKLGGYSNMLSRGGIVKVGKK